MKFSQYPFHVPNVEKVKKELTKLLTAFKEAKNADEAARLMKKISTYADDLSTDLTIISVKFSQDANNEEYVKAQEYVDHNMPYVSALLNEYNKLVLASPYRKALEEKFGSYLFKMLEVSAKTFDPSIIELLQKEAMLENDIKNTAGAKFFDGEIYNLSTRKFTQQRPWYKTFKRRKY